MVGRQIKFTMINEDFLDDMVCELMFESDPESNEFKDLIIVGLYLIYFKVTSIFKTKTK